MATSPDGTPEALAVDIVEDDVLYALRRFFLMLASSTGAHGLNTGTLWWLKPSA